MGSNETRPTLEEAYAHYEREGGDSTTADILAAAVARALEDHTTPEDCERAGKSHDFITSEVGTRTFCQVCGGSWAVGQNTPWDWAICHDGGVSDRFHSREEAEDALAGGDYPQGGTVEYVPDPTR